MLSGLINKWLHFEDRTNLEKIEAEIRTGQDYDSLIKVYMDLYRKNAHAQKRYLLLVLLNHLLLKFHAEIGNRVMEHLMEIVELTQAKLLPKDWALKLKEFIFESLEKWAKEYPQYRAFKIAHQNILDSHGGDRSSVFFPKKEISKSLMQVYDRSFEAVHSEFTKSKDDLIEMEQKLETGIELLLETQNVFGKQILSPSKKNLQASKSLPLKTDIHRYGLGSSSYNLHLSIDVNTLKLVETDDNSILFEEIREGCKLIEKKYLPNISNWTKKVAKIQMNDEHQEFLKELIMTKSRLNQILSNVRNLGIVWNMPRALIPKSVQVLDSDDEDEVFLAVSQDESPQFTDAGNHMNSNNQQNECLPVSSKDFQEETELDVKSDKCDEQEMTTNTEISSQKAILLQKAPIVPYDDDLEYWDKTDVPFNTSGLEFQHRFLGAGTGERMLSKDTVDKLKMRTISLPAPEKIPIERSCNAPLKNGKLCRRKDLRICPVHGVIIERDSEGYPLDDSVISISDSIPEWQKLEDAVNRAHPIEKRKSQIEDIKKKTSKQRIDSKLSKSERGNGSSDAFEANLRLRDRQAFKW